MAKKSISVNYIYNLFYQILVIVLPLITTPYLSRTLGAEAIGIYGYTLSVATYFILAGSLGVSIYGQREIAYLQDDKEKRSITFWEILLMKVITMTISLIAFGITFAIDGKYAVYYRILIIEIVSQLIDISWFFQGIEEFKKTVVRNSIVKLLFLVCIFVFVKSPADLFKYVFITTGANLIGNFSLWLYLPKFVQKVKLKELKIFRHFKPTLSLFIPQIAIQIYTVLDKTMIGKVYDDKSEVGFYEQAQKIVKLLLTIVTSLGTVMIPRIANMFSNGNMEKVKEYLAKSFRFTYFLAFPIMFGIILITDEFVPIFFGDGYEKVAILIKIIVPITLFIGMSNVFGVQYLLPTKKQKEYTISVTAGACINFILNIILIRKYGAIGASISTVIAEFMVTSIQFFYARNLLTLKEMFDLAKNSILATTIMFACTYGISRGLHLTGKVSIIVQVVVGVITYTIPLIILKDEFVFYIKDRGMGIINGKILKKKSIEENN